MNKMNIFNCLHKNGFTKQRNQRHPRVGHRTKELLFFGTTFLAQVPDDKDNTPQELLLSAQEEKD